MTKQSTLNNLKELYVHELQDIYSAEKQITQALPKLAKAANNEDLKNGFQEHLEQTKGQIQRLDKIFERLGQSSAGEKCKGMQGLLEEGGDFTQEKAAPEVLDAGMIVAAQKVEHYEIAAYGSVCRYAELLGFDEDLQLLQETLEEEKETDQKLTELSDDLNEQANEGSEEESEEEMQPSAKGKSQNSK
ncbi:MAG: ferritin-like domain-containing protein [Candidatus Omnitrophica bacterium]|nr:ferritin-like domain-containing protein [Candidatus Omnitrophota bacterium]